MGGRGLPGRRFVLGPPRVADSAPVSVCRFTATRIPNHALSKPSLSTSGSRKGTTISTIGTHSSGQPSRKMSAMMMKSITYGLRSSPRSSSVSMPGVPRRANTAPKKFEAATRKRIRTEISSVRMSASLRLARVSRP